MQTRYIRKNDNLYYAVVIDGKYQLPVSVINRFLMEPQYVILSEKKELLEVMYYTFYKTIQEPDYLSPGQAKQMFIPASHVVEAGSSI